MNDDDVELESNILNRKATFTGDDWDLLYQAEEEQTPSKPELTNEERYERSLRLPRGTVATTTSSKSKASRKVRSKSKGNYKPWQASARMVRTQRQTIITAWDDNHERAVS